MAILEELLSLEPAEISDLSLWLVRVEYFDAYLHDKYDKELMNLRLRFLNEERAVENLVNEMLKCIHPSHTYPIEGLYHASAGHVSGISGDINWSMIKGNKRGALKKVLTESGFTGKVTPTENCYSEMPYLRFCYSPNKTATITKKISKSVHPKEYSDRGLW